MTAPLSSEECNGLCTFHGYHGGRQIVTADVNCPVHGLKAQFGPAVVVPSNQCAACEHMALEVVRWEREADRLRAALERITQEPVEHTLTPMYNLRQIARDALASMPADGPDEPTSRPVMNPPADEAEAGNRVHAAPPQADSDAGRRGMAGPLTESEARPVMPTARDALQTNNHLHEWIRSELAEYQVLIDKGKGTWPGPDYVRDDTWHYWQGALSKLEQAARLIPAVEIAGQRSGVLPRTGAYAPSATCKHGVHPYDCRQGCDPHTMEAYTRDKVRKLRDFILAAPWFDPRTMACRDAIDVAIERLSVETSTVISKEAGNGD